jgi:hypothetical protein
MANRLVFRATALFFVFGAPLLVAQTAAPQSGLLDVQKTHGAWNGRFWKQLSAEEKRVFLFGYLAAVDRVPYLRAMAITSGIRR